MSVRKREEGSFSQGKDRVTRGLLEENHLRQKEKKTASREKERGGTKFRKQGKSSF